VKATYEINKPIWGESNVELDATKILREDDNELVIPAIFARETVLTYPNGKAYRPAAELQESLFTFEGAFLVPDKHPDTMILTKPKTIIGKAQNIQWDAAEHRVKGEVVINKKRAPSTFIADIKNGVKRDVSIGFIHDEDWSPGEFNGQKYDYIQRNIIVNHIAIGVPKGRDPFPYLGLGLDQALAKMGADPWEQTEEYIRSGHGSVEMAETCRTTDFNGKLPQGMKAIYCKKKGSDEWYVQSYIFPVKEGWTMDKAKTWFNSHQDANVLVDEDEKKLPGTPQGAPPASGSPPGAQPPGATTPGQKPPGDDKKKDPPPEPERLDPDEVHAETRRLLEIRKYRNK